MRPPFIAVVTDMPYPTVTENTGNIFDRPGGRPPGEVSKFRPPKSPETLEILDDSICTFAGAFKTPMTIAIKIK